MFDDFEEPTLGPGFGRDLETWLDETYDGDEHAKAAARADLHAIADNAATPATCVHETITARVWALLRDLDVRSGRMLVLGQDAEVLAGLPGDERRLPPGAAAGFWAPIPPRSVTGGAPHPGLPLRRFDDDSPAPFDVVLLIPPGADITLHRAGVRDARTYAHHLALVGALTRTAPGRYLVSLVPHDVMDDPDRAGRLAISRHADLVGGVRLPAGVLRPGLPGNDGCVDLLLWRRHTGPVSRLHLFPFVTTVDFPLGGRNVAVNQYWIANPTHVLGTHTTRATPWGVEVTVEPVTGADLGPLLTRGLHEVVQRAQLAGLAAGPRVGAQSVGHDAGPDDVDTPIPYTLASRHDLATARREIARARAEDGARGLPAGQIPVAPPRAAMRREDGLGPRR